MGLSLPVTTMRVFHIMSADDTMRPNEMTWSKICRARMRFKLANMSPNILLNSSAGNGDGHKIGDAGVNRENGVGNVHENRLH